MSEHAPRTPTRPRPRYALGRWLALGAALTFLIAGSARLAPRVPLMLHKAQLHPTTGIVTSSGVLEHGGRDYVTARVTVRYTVDGSEYVLRTSGQDGLATRAGSPEAFVARHPVGARMPVYYLADSPEHSTLTREVDIAPDLVFLGVLAVLATALAASLVRRPRAPKNEVHNAPGDASADSSAATPLERRSTDE